MAPKAKVWRFQRGTMTTSNIVSAMTHDRQNVLHFELDGLWQANFGERFTFYARALVVGQFGKPRLRIVEEVTEEAWK